MHKTKKDSSCFTDIRTPYIDNSPAENGTQYYAYFILGDTEVGQQSDVITIEV